MMNAAKSSYSQDGNLRRQLAEITMLHAMYTDEIELSPSLVDLLREFSEVGSCPATGTPRLAFSVRCCAAAPCCVDGKIDDNAPFVAVISFSLPPQYPTTSPPHWRLEASKLTKPEFDEVLHTVNEGLAPLMGSECLAFIVETARTTLLRTRGELAEEDLLRYDEVALLQREMVTSMADNRLGRRCMYFHHILGVGKRQCIAHWAKALGINGFCKIGYPGILVVEGPEACMVEYVRGLQRLRWKLMVVRGEEVEVAASPEAVDSLRRIAPHGVVEMTSSSEIGERCKDAGVQELFRTSMKIYGE